MTWVKICGIARAEDAAAAATAGADAVGFVFYPPSPRAISPERAAMLAKALPRHVARVGVFVNASVASMQALREHIGLDFIQLHGDEGPDIARALGGRIIRAVRGAAGAGSIANFPAEAVLVDGERAGFYGGTGTPAAPAAIAAARAQAARWILSGGLAPENVAARIAAFAPWGRPWGVDVSSGVESAPGIKDANRIAAFVAAVRASGESPGRAADRNVAHSLGDDRSAARAAPG